MESKIVLKAKYLDDLRRLPISRRTNYKSLEQILANIFNIVVHSIKYQDDEGDEIRITCDEELNEAYRLAAKTTIPVLRVTLEGERYERKVTVSVPNEEPLLTSYTPKIVRVSSAGNADVVIFEDEKGNTQVNLLKEQICVNLPTSLQPQIEDISFRYKEKTLTVSQLADYISKDISQLSVDTTKRNVFLAEEASTIGNEEREQMKASTFELSKISAEKVVQLSRSIAEATEKVASSAALLGDELCKVTLSNMLELSDKARERTNELSDKARERTNELSSITSQRLDEVLRNFKQQMQQNGY